MTAQEQNFLEIMAYVFLQNARPDRAAVLLQALDALHPGQAQVLRALALAQVRSAKPERALQNLERLAMAGGVDATFHLLRAQALQALKRTDEAAQAMQLYVQLRPTHPALARQADN